MSAHKPKLICITGGAASGKSTFANLLALRMQAEEFSADKAVHDLLSGDVDVIASVCERFPTAWIDGQISRSELGRIVFNNGQDRNFLEELLHPRVYNLCDEAWIQAQNNNCNLVAEIPLLFESGANERFPFVILVAASPGIQLQRLQEQRKIDFFRARSVLSAQWPNEQKIERAHVVVWNDGSLRMLEEQARKVAQQLDSCS